jgi:hypothetical protein
MQNPSDLNPVSLLSRAGGHIQCLKCTAQSKRSGVQCRRLASKSSKTQKCHMHGGRGNSAPKSEAGRQRVIAAHIKSGRNTDYYLIAKLRAHLGETPAQLKFVPLQATWESKSQPKYGQYPKMALEAYNEALKQEYADRQQWLPDQLVAGELERRLRQFDKTLIRFVSLENYPDIQSSRCREILQL